MWGWSKGRFAVAATTLVTAIAGAPAAQAADGDLFIDGCIARAAFPSCGAGLPANPVGVAVSPDGNQVYAAVGVIQDRGGTFNGLQILDRVGDKLVPRPGAEGCYVATNAAVPCTKVGGVDNPTEAYDVTVSPDGRNVYLATVNGALLSFARDTEKGWLSYRNCVGVGNGCTPLTGNQNAESVAVSPDSAHVYVRGTNGLAVLDRNGNGTVTQKPGGQGCLNEGDIPNCQNVDGLASNGWRLAVSPDGRQVYASFQDPGGVSIFDRASDGTLTQRLGACISSNGVSGAAGIRCVDGNDSLGTTYIATVSPDGRTVYVGGEGGMSVYDRLDNGLLAQAGCFGATPGCTPVEGGLAGVLDIAPTPDSSEVVAAGYGSRSVVSFTRSPSNVVRQRAGLRGCLSEGGSAGRCLTLGQVSNDWMRIAMDPRLPQFFVTSRWGMLAMITRDFAPTCSAVDVSTAMNTAVSIPLSCADRNGDAFTIYKDGAPGTGQVGEILNGSIFYNPFGNFTGTDTFTYRAFTPGRGVSSEAATVRVNITAPNLSPTGIDKDRDGFNAGLDCNDDNAAIRPGAQEIRGNNLDENCDGFAEPFPTLGSGVVSKWDVKGTRLTLTTLQVTQAFPNGWKAVIKCSGKPKCAFRSKTLKAGKVKKAASTIISSLSRSQRRFRAGQTLEVWVSAPNFNTKVARLVLKKGKIPTTEPFCVKAGETKVQKSCS